MADEKTKQDLEKYLQDIQTIRELLSAVEKNPLYENWVFYVWGALILLGSLLHTIIESSFSPSLQQLFLKIWLPVILVMAFFELIAFVRNMSKRSLPLFTRDVVRLIVGLAGSTAALCVVLLILLELNGARYLPVALLASGAIFYFVLAQQACYMHLFVHGFFFILLAILLYLFRVQHPLMVLGLGSIFAVSMVIVGITDRIAEKREK
jgi:hypothetical protein